RRAESAVVQGIEVARVRVVPRAVDVRAAAARHRAVGVGGGGGCDRGAGRVCWCPIATRGRALSGPQYPACLIYDETANPVFDAWTREHGGGPPCLWHYRRHVLEESSRVDKLEVLGRFI